MEHNGGLCEKKKDAYVYGCGSWVVGVVCAWVTLLDSRNLTEHGKQAMIEKNKHHFRKRNTALNCFINEVIATMKMNIYVYF